jgi:hypothetical protein
MPRLEQPARTIGHPTGGSQTTANAVAGVVAAGHAGADKAVVVAAAVAIFRGVGDRPMVIARVEVPPIKMASPVGSIERGAASAKGRLF